MRSMLFRLDPFATGNTLLCDLNFEHTKLIIMHVVPVECLFNIFHSESSDSEFHEILEEMFPYYW